MIPSPGSGDPRAYPRRRRHLRAACQVIAVVAVGFIVVSPTAADAVGAVAPAASSRAPTAPAAAPAADTGQWTWPVPAPIRVVDPFRAPPTPYAAGHRGIDIRAERGVLVVAAAPGVVSFAGQVAGRGVVSIDHGGGVISAIEPVETSVARGTPIAAGETIGVVSSGGHCDARCVHFGVRIDGEYVSPFLFLGGLPRAVLLPMG